MNIPPRFLLRLLTALTLAAVVTAPVHGQLLITEVMSNSGSSGATGQDWFELTNFGNSSVDITGYRMDDNSNSFALSVPLLGVTSIAAHESVVFIEDSSLSTNITAFRNFWGGSALTAQIGNYSGSGVGLSSSGDAVNVYTSGNVLVNSVTFGTATTGVSFGYNTTSSTFGALSSVGQFGAFQSANALHNIGSPGSVGFTVVPEPGTSALIAGLCVLGAVMVRRARKQADAMAELETGSGEA